MKISLVNVSPEFKDGYSKRTKTAMFNFAVKTGETIAQYVPVDTGALRTSVQAVMSGDSVNVVSGVPYAIRRNFENNLHPMTLNYIERAVEYVENNHQLWWPTN